MAEALEDAVLRAFVARLTTADPDDPLLDVIASRWVAQHDPEALAQRAATLAALNQEKAALAKVDDDHYVHRTLDRERHARLSQAISRRIVGLQRDLDSRPLPQANIAPLLDSALLREAWEAATIPQRRDLLRLALDGVIVAWGRQGVRFDPASRLTFRWASVDVPADPSA